jgi:hypothetical protein
MIIYTVENKNQHQLFSIFKFTVRALLVVYRLFIEKESHNDVHCL